MICSLLEKYLEKHLKDRHQANRVPITFLEDDWMGILICVFIKTFIFAQVNSSCWSLQLCTIEVQML